MDAPEVNGSCLIGQIGVQALAALGASVIVHGRNAARGAEVVQQVEAAGGQARFVAADLTDPAEVDRQAKAAGDVDILVTNAGRSRFGPSAELDVDTYDAMLNGNVRSAYLLTAAIAPAMGRRGTVNVDSWPARSGWRPRP